MQDGKPQYSTIQNIAAQHSAILQVGCVQSWIGSWTAGAAWSTATQTTTVQ